MSIRDIFDRRPITCVMVAIYSLSAILAVVLDMST